MTYARKLDAIFEKVKAALFHELEDPAWVLRREERKLIVELVKDEDDCQEDCHGDDPSSCEGDVRVKEEPPPISAEDLADIKESEDEKMIALGGSFDWTQLDQLPENQSKFISGRIRGPNGKFMRTRKKTRLKSLIPQPGGRKKGSKNKSEVDALLANVEDSTCNICDQIFDGGSSLSRHLRQGHSAVGLVVDGVGRNSEEEEIVISGTDAQSLLDSLDSASQPKRARRTIPCFVCGAHYRIKSWLYKHLTDDHPNEKIPCCVCQSRLGNFAELTRHLTEVHEAPNPILICDLCGVYSVSEDQQVVHVKEAHPEEAEVVACPLCPRELLSLAKLDSHLSESHEMTVDFEASGEISQFECRVCKLVFTDVSSADSHEHTEEETVRTSRKDCPHCGECVTDLKAHLALSHPEQQAYKCKEPNCRSAFPTLDRLTRHVRDTHPKNPDLKAICDICAKVFPNANRARRHMKTAHTTGNFFCDVCGKQCANAGALSHHKLRSHSLTDFCCHLCNSKFTLNSNLKRHIQSAHLKTRSTCPDCGKTFSQDHLLRHRKSVHEGKRYPCKHCEKHYSQKGDLAKHVKAAHV